MMQMRVTFSTPGKLMLLGEHSVVYGRPCLVTAVDQRMWVTAQPTGDAMVHLSALSLGVDDWVVPVTEVDVADPPASVRFLHGAVRCLNQRHTLPYGVFIQAHSEFSSQLGLGSSAAVTVAATVALSQLICLELSKQDLFSMAYDAVQIVQGVASGFDVAASLFGGTLYYRRWGPKIVPLEPVPLPIIVGYSGTKADTILQVQRVRERYKEQPDLVEEVFDGMARLVDDGRKALLTQDWWRLGRVMSLAQSLLDSLGVNTPKLAHLVHVAEEAGAFGAKLSGAGGGDCMIALVGEKQRSEVKKAIQDAGGEVIPIKAGAPGARREDSEQIEAGGWHIGVHRAPDV